MVSYNQSINCNYNSGNQSEELFSSSLAKKFPIKRLRLDEISLKKRVDGKIHTTWQEYTVPNVSKYLIQDYNLRPTTIKCQEFSSNRGVENDKWFWSITFMHCSAVDLVHVHAGCAKNDPGERAIISIYIVDNKKNEIFVGHGPRRYCGGCNLKVTSFFEQKKEIDKDKFLPNDNLTLRLKLTILLDDKTPLPSHVTIQLEPKAILPNHFKDLYLNRENTGDIVINVKDKLFRAHKEVFKIRYPRLLEMFANQIIQGRNAFEIPGMDCEVFEKLLEFLYLDQVSNIDNCIVLLWNEAHKYKLTALKRICEKSISENFLSLENVDIINYLSRKFKSDEMCFCISMFLVSNRE